MRNIAAAGQWDSIFKSNLSLCSQWGRNCAICMTTAKGTEQWQINSAKEDKAEYT